MINKNKEASDAFKAVAVKRIEKMFRGDSQYDRGNYIREKVNKAIKELKTPAKAIAIHRKIQQLNKKVNDLTAELKKIGYDVHYGDTLQVYNDSPIYHKIWQDERDKNYSAERSLIAKVYGCGTVEEVEGVLAEADKASR